MGIGINSTLIVDGMELELIPGKGRNGPLSALGKSGTCMHSCDWLTVPALLFQIVA